MVTLIETGEQTIDLHMVQPDTFIRKRYADIIRFTARRQDNDCIRFAELQGIHQQVGQYDLTLGGVERHFSKRFVEIIYQLDIPDLELKVKVTGDFLQPVVDWLPGQAQRFASNLHLTDIQHHINIIFDPTCLSENTGQ